MAPRAGASRARPSSSAARPSITVSTRLRNAERPATWGAAQGAGVIPSSSTTPSTRSAGKAIRRPARRPMRSSSAMALASFDAAQDRFRGGERADQGGAVVAVDALALGRGADADDVGIGRDRVLLAGDDDVGG